MHARRRAARGERLFDGAARFRVGLASGGAVDDDLEAFSHIGYRERRADAAAKDRARPSDD
jgi:hypothetical protein